MEPVLQTKNEKSIKIVIWITTIVIVGAVTILNRKVLPEPSSIPSFIFKFLLLFPSISLPFFLLLSQSVIGQITEDNWPKIYPPRP